MLVVLAEDMLYPLLKLAEYVFQWQVSKKSALIC